LLTQRSEVTTDEAKAFAIQNGCSYIEVSAKTGENVNNIFQELTEEILRKIDSHVIDVQQTVLN